MFNSPDKSPETKKSNKKIDRIRKVGRMCYYFIFYGIPAIAVGIIALDNLNKETEVYNTVENTKAGVEKSISKQVQIIPMEATGNYVLDSHGYIMGKQKPIIVENGDTFYGILEEEDVMLDGKMVNIDNVNEKFDPKKIRPLDHVFIFVNGNVLEVVISRPKKIVDVNDPGNEKNYTGGYTNYSGRLKKVEKDSFFSGILNILPGSGDEKIIMFEVKDNDTLYSILEDKGFRLEEEEKKSFLKAGYVVKIIDDKKVIVEDNNGDKTFKGDIVKIKK